MLFYKDAVCVYTNWRQLEKKRDFVIIIIIIIQRGETIFQKWLVGRDTWGLTVAVCPPPPQAQTKHLYRSHAVRTGFNEPQLRR